MDANTFRERILNLDERSINFLRATYGQPVEETDTEPLAVNSCGECIHCCVYPAISAEQYAHGSDLSLPEKKFGEKCSQCTGSGCSIYNKRPHICKGYQCLWKLGVVDSPPNETGVAWCVEPCVDQMGKWVVVGHCADADTILASSAMRSEILNLIGARFMNLPVVYVILRTPTTASRITMRHGLKFLVKTCDVVDHRPVISTMRSQVVRVMQPEVAQ